IGEGMPVDGDAERFEDRTRLARDAAAPIHERAEDVEEERADHAGPAAGTTATVQRETHTALPCSSSMRISQTCVRRPTCTGVAVAVTVPSRFARRWFALISIPTTCSRDWSQFIHAPVEATVSASATEAPPCSRPNGWCTRGPTGMRATTRSFVASTNSMPSVARRVSSWRSEKSGIRRLRLREAAIVAQARIGPRYL